MNYIILVGKRILLISWLKILVKSYLIIFIYLLAWKNSKSIYLCFYYLIANVLSEWEYYKAFYLLSIYTTINSMTNTVVICKSTCLEITSLWWYNFLIIQAHLPQWRYSYSTRSSIMELPLSVFQHWNSKHLL